MPRTAALPSGRNISVWILIGSILAIALGSAQPQKRTAVRPEFEVASIKLDKGCEDYREGHDERPVPSPGRLQMNCMSLDRLIQLAYLSFANGASFSRQVLEIMGGPGWIHSDQYDLAAKAEDNAGVARMSGPMLQTLLEDRFRLKIHRETKEAAVYALTVAKSGLKLQPAKEGGCVARDLDHLPPPIAPGQMEPHLCDEVVIRMSGEYLTIEGHGMKMAEFTQGISFDPLLDRPVIDKTGFEGLFDFHLKCSRRLRDGGGKGGGSGSPVVPAEVPGSSISVALQEQLGLKLVPEKGPVELLVIDHVERPTAN